MGAVPQEVVIASPLRIASVPADHVYVHHLCPVDGSALVSLLPDPPVPGAPAGQWWPSPVLEPDWLRAHADAFDVLHLHFGFEHRTVDQLRELVAALRALDRPLVLTVHDLTNPHLTDQRPHAAALDVLIPAASSVITLTPGAAAEIGRRWGRRAVVLPHPHVVELDRLAAPRRAHHGFVVALHDKNRAGNDPDAVRAELTAAVASLPGAQLHPGHPHRLADAELWDHLSALDALVLPYRAGTHSGFLEACYDLGTTVLAPRTGFFAEQHPVVSYDLDVPGSLAAAVRRVHAERPSWRAVPAERARQREELAAAHAALYAAVLAVPVAA